MTSSPGLKCRRNQTSQLLHEALSGDSPPELVLVSEVGAGAGNTTPVFVIPTHVPPATTMTVAEDCR